MLHCVYMMLCKVHCSTWTCACAGHLSRAWNIHLIRWSLPNVRKSSGNIPVLILDQTMRTPRYRCPDSVSSFFPDLWLSLSHQCSIELLDRTVVSIHSSPCRPDAQSKRCKLACIGSLSRNALFAKSAGPYIWWWPRHLFWAISIHAALICMTGSEPHE